MSLTFSKQCQASSRVETKLVRILLFNWFGLLINRTEYLMTKEFSAHTFSGMNGIIVRYVTCMEGWKNWQFYKYNVSLLLSALSAIVATL